MKILNLLLKKKKQSSLMLLFFLMFSFTAFAQKDVVRGTVTDAADNSPIPGVSILVQGTTVGTSTDFDGNYTIKAKLGDILVFSYLGMKQQKLKVKKTTLSVAMDADVQSLDEIVVIGYGTRKKKELTGSVARVKADEIENVITSDLSTALQGQIAGVSVVASSGEPGEGSSILIRGVSSLSGSNDPLFVVDGVPQSGDPRLNPNEIETIDVLKDAASASIYGTRAAGGVILITTKRGKVGNAKISLEVSNGIQIITRQTPLMNTTEQVFFDLNDPTRSGSSARSDRFSLLNDNDLRDLTENNYAQISRYNFNISGGDEGATYSVVLGVFDQEGTVINSGLRRYNLRSNVNVTKNKWTFNNGFGFTIDDRERPNFNLLIQGQRALPYLDEVSPESLSVVNDNDEAAGPYEQILEALTRERQVKRYRFEANTNIKYKINKHFDFTTLISGVITHEEEKQIQPKFELFDSNGINLRAEEDSFVFEEREKTILLNFNAGLNYNQKFGKHNVSALALVNIEQENYTSIAAVNKGLSFSNPTNLSLGTLGAEAVSSGNVGINGPNFIEPDYITKRVGTVGRVLYDYDGKYLFSASARLDASNQFSKDNLYAFFPSVSAGWNISDEKFWSNYKGTINNFKLRASIGTTGNDRFAANSVFSPVFTGYNAYFDSEAGTTTEKPGFVQQSFGNPSLKWEVTTQRNIGLDMSFFRNKLTLTADYYVTDKKDLLSNIRINPSFGAPATVERFVGTNFAVFNIGNMTNKGFEAALRYRPKTGNVRWNILGTFTKNKNEVTSINGSVGTQLFPTQSILGDIFGLPIGLQVGREAGSFLLYETDGLLRSQEEVDVYNATYGEQAQIGDLKYIDSDNNGSVRDFTDRVYKGSGLPDYEVGLNIQATYKNFYFATNWYASVGNEVYNATRANAFRAGRAKDLVYQFIPGVNENTNIPSFRSRNRGDANFNGSSDFFIEDGSFIRLRNVVFGYTLPSEVSEKLGLTRFNMFANAQNVLTITNYTGLDPEVGGNNIQQKGVDRGLIPVTASFNFGFRVNF
ncbi:TonB-dependent receptor [Polaribacter sp. PL03]|uniref:SusC/RagA family TonB-linked outer membrane protein n=1 Tax=Polaribacter sp. PL03 TaxID=3088353 RepID=UPI0029D0E789|nr:TonB-dependent receptor [Polaribacter sp. PL03]MDX6747933.1 TonB-dependent receptor [Polaribacter sp. PL03]